MPLQKSWRFLILGCIGVSFQVLTMTPIGTSHEAVRRAALRRLGASSFFLCTAGWAFPHVCTEDMDLTTIQNEQTAGTR